jgi:hypothetical protein
MDGNWVANGRHSDGRQWAANGRRLARFVCTLLVSSVVTG